MKLQGRFWTGVLGASGMLVLILDAKTGLKGGIDGIMLCLNTVIPTLFPFFLFSNLLNSTISGIQLPFMKPISKILGVPAGAESLFLLGILGGYPVGAQCVSESYRCGRIEQQDAKRMLGFCNNAGPAFIFGMGTCLFENKVALWALWGVHIVSALMVGAVLPNKRYSVSRLPRGEYLTVPQALNKALKTICSVCGWVIIFRILLTFLEKWCLWLIGNQEQIFVAGILELSNGCYRLLDTVSQGTRFVMCATFLGFGGLCVLMQTTSVTGSLGTGMYFPGKVIQATISLLISGLLQSVLFHPSERWNCWLQYGILGAAICATTIILLFKKKRVEICC